MEEEFKFLAGVDEDNDSDDDEDNDSDDDEEN